MGLGGLYLGRFLQGKIGFFWGFGGFCLFGLGFLGGLGFFGGVFGWAKNPEEKRIQQLILRGFILKEQEDGKCEESPKKGPMLLPRR